MELNEKEKGFILRLLTNLTVNPTAPDAAEIVAIVQELRDKLTETK